MANRLLLLGGGGFVGQALAARWVALGRLVHIVSRHESELAIPGVNWHVGSLDDASLMVDLLPKCGVVIHLASTCTPGSSARFPVREGEENLVPLLRLMELLGCYEPRPFMFLSSGGTVYGDPISWPVDETAPVVPLSYHGAAKGAAELFLSVFARQGWPVTILRPSNLYGPGQLLRVGFGVVRTVLEHARQGTTIELWGDGEAVRDYLYIEDFVEAVLAVLSTGVVGTFNVGSGKGCSLNRLLVLTGTVTGRTLTVKRRPARSTDVSGIALDWSRLHAATGWVPAVSLEEGLRQTWRWVLAQS